MPGNMFYFQFNGKTFNVFCSKLNLVFTPIDCIFVMCEKCRYPNQFGLCEYTRMPANMLYYQFYVNRFRFSWQSF